MTNGVATYGQQVGGPLVLLVDDYDDSREMYAEFLEHSGFRVCQARDGGQALAKARELRPDLILMDLSLPGMSGWEAIHRLKSNATTQAIPVIALSGHKQADASGQPAPQWDYFLMKPCQPEELVENLHRALADAGRSTKKQ
jgi:CheY-like chemotaxis protein